MLQRGRRRGKSSEQEEGRGDVGWRARGQGAEEEQKEGKKVEEEVDEMQEVATGGVAA